MNALLRVVLLFSLVVAHAGATPLAGQSAYRTYLPQLATPDVLVYVSNFESGLQIEAAALDGSNRHVLSGPTTNDSYPVPSPDGRLIAFLSTRDGRSSPYLMERDGSGQRRITDCNICWPVSWSPDSRQLWLEEGRDVLWRFDLDGAPPLRLRDCLTMTDDGARCAYLDWSLELHRLLVRSPITAEPVVLVSSTNSINDDFAWSPDGRSLAYSTTFEGKTTLYVVGLDGQPPRRLATGHSPYWSPRGDEIAYLTAGTSTGSYTLNIVDIASGTSRLLATEVSEWEELSWSPDGQQIAVLKSGDGHNQFEIVDRGGATPIPVIFAGPLGVIRWSPDSSRLVTIMHSGYGEPRVFTLDRDGSNLREVGMARDVVWGADSRSLLLTSHVTRPARVFSQIEGAPVPQPIAEGGWPALSQDRRRLAYVRAGRLYLAPVTGQGERALAEGVVVTGRPAWSRDGLRLAVGGSTAAGASLFVIEVDTGATLPIADCAPGTCDEPAWSTDGAALLFTLTDTVADPNAPRGTRTREQLFVVPAAGGERRRLTEGRYGTWSPDGAQIAFIGPAGPLFVIGAAGGDLRELYSCPRNRQETCSRPAWSPDGTRLSLNYYVDFSGKGSRSDVIIIDAASGAELQRFEGSQATWRGARLAYVYPARFAPYEGGYDTGYRYYKLCVRFLTVDRCQPLPAGHGDILDYAVAP